MAVPESVVDDLKSIRELLDYVAKCGFCPPTHYAEWRERVAMYDRLLDFDSETTFIKKEKKRRPSQKKKDGTTSKKKAASLESGPASHSESGAVGC